MLGKKKAGAEDERKKDGPGDAPSPATSRRTIPLPNLETASRLKTYVGSAVGSALDSASGVPAWLAARALPSGGSSGDSTDRVALFARRGPSAHYDELLDDDEEAAPGLRSGSASAASPPPRASAQWPRSPVGPPSPDVGSGAARRRSFTSLADGHGRAGPRPGPWAPARRATAGTEEPAAAFSPLRASAPEAALARPRMEEPPAMISFDSLEPGAVPAEQAVPEPSGAASGAEAMRSARAGGDANAGVGGQPAASTPTPSPQPSGLRQALQPRASPGLKAAASRLVGALPQGPARGGRVYGRLLPDDARDTDEGQRAAEVMPAASPSPRSNSFGAGPLQQHIWQRAASSQNGDTGSPFPSRHPSQTGMSAPVTPLPRPSRPPPPRPADPAARPDTDEETPRLHAPANAARASTASGADDAPHRGWPAMEDSGGPAPANGAAQPESAPEWDIFEPRAGERLPPTNGGLPTNGRSHTFPRGAPALAHLSGRELLRRLEEGTPMRKKWVTRLKTRADCEAAPKTLRTIRCQAASSQVVLKYFHQGVKGLLDGEEVAAVVQRVEAPGGVWAAGRCILVFTSRGVLALEPPGPAAFTLWTLGLNAALAASQARRREYYLSCPAHTIPRNTMFTVAD